VDISQTARKVVFTATFMAGGLKTSFAEGRLRIETEGNARKFVKAVEQLTFSAAYARLRGKSVLYVTERAVFRLIDSGLELIEIAPGIDLDGDVLAKMDFKPAIANPLKIMAAELFGKS
jgi:propionate CoA-transferase